MYLNSELKAWHGVWNTHLKGNVRLSSFVRKMLIEDRMWSERVAEFEIAPANGIKGPYDRRKGIYVRQDKNLRTLVDEFDNRDPLIYLRACAYHLHF